MKTAIRWTMGAIIALAFVSGVVMLAAVAAVTAGVVLAVKAINGQLEGRATLPPPPAPPAPDQRPLAALPRGDQTDE
jgi:hypothetical protein